MSPVSDNHGLPLGAGQRPGRAAFEFYPTPPAAVRALLSVEEFDAAIWEPACGDGRISTVLEAASHDVISTDITDHGFGTPGIDFLKESVPRARHIVTNPPYGFGLADRFVRHALALTAKTGGTVAMLLNLSSLCHPDRHSSFIRRPPVRVWALDRCVCYPNGRPAEATRFTHSHRYCWAIWTPGYVGPTTLGWLSTYDS